MLLELGANVDAEDDQDGTPFQICVAIGEGIQQDYETVVSENMVPRA